MNIILPDYHIHTHFCKHADGKMDDYVEHALDIGLKEIGFSGHMPVMPEPQFCMDFEELPYYVDSVHELRERYKGRIDIRLGCEMDIVENRIDDIKSIISSYPFDYVIGSIHYLDGWPFDQGQYSDRFEEDDIDEIYERFFDAVIRMIETQLFDIAGHIDIMKCLGYRPERTLTHHYERVASVLKSCDIAVEVNTGGIDKPCREPYPSEEFLRILHRFEIPVTAGSDAHSSGDVGRYFDRALRMLESAGYDHVMYFKDRKRFPEPLQSPADSNENSHSANSSRLS